MVNCGDRPGAHAGGGSAQTMLAFCATLALRTAVEGGPSPTGTPTPVPTAPIFGGAATATLPGAHCGALPHSTVMALSGCCAASWEADSARDGAPTAPTVPPPPPGDGSLF